MTVAELIALLMKYPTDLEVLTDEGFEDDRLDDQIVVRPAHYVGDDPKVLTSEFRRPDAKPCLLIY